MKREIFALLLLASLAALSVWNTHRVDAVTAEVEEHLRLSEKAVMAGDPIYAGDELKAATRLWLSARHVTRVFLSHPELDDASQLFFEAVQCLREGETRSMPAAFAQLRVRLNCVRDMQHVSFQSVF